MADHYHVLAWTEAIDSTADSDIQPLTDEVIPITNGHYLLPEDFDLHWIWAGSANLNRAFLRAPSLRTITDPFIRPLDRSATPTDDPAVADYSGNPFRLPRLEELELRATSGIATGTEQFTAVAGLMKQFVPAPRGQVFTLRGTSSDAAVANQWTTLPNVTWHNTLAEGVYAIVGGVHYSANGKAFRLIMPDQQARPGALSITSLGNREHELFRRGNLGEWGRFRTFYMPVVQVLCGAADSTHEIYLDLVKVG